MSTCLFAAYTLDEVDQMTRSLRASAKYTVGDDDATALDVRIRAPVYSHDYCVVVLSHFNFRSRIQIHL